MRVGIRGSRTVSGLLRIMIVMALLPCVPGAASIAPPTVNGGEAMALYVKFIAQIQPNVRQWMREQGSEISRGPIDEDALYDVIRVRFAGQECSSVDVIAIALGIFSEACIYSDMIIEQYAEQIKTYKDAKQQLSELHSAIERDLVLNAGREDTDSCAPPGCGEYQTALKNTAEMLGRIYNRTTLVVRKPATVQQLKSLAKDVRSELANIEKMIKGPSYRLEILMAHRGEVINALSKIRKKISETEDIMVQNLK